MRSIPHLPHRTHPTTLGVDIEPHADPERYESLSALIETRSESRSLWFHTAGCGDPLDLSPDEVREWDLSEGTAGVSSGRRETGRDAERLEHLRERAKPRRSHSAWTRGGGAPS